MSGGSWILIIVAILAIIVRVLLNDSDYSLGYTYTGKSCKETVDSTESLLIDESVTRTTHYVAIGCYKLHVWVYASGTVGKDAKALPAIVLAHGLGAQKDMGLEPYAVDFVRAGFVAVAIDYRTFGGSVNCCSDNDANNSFRNHIYPWHHVEDISAVLEWIKTGSLPFVDASRIGLWGTSFAGGHMLTVANRYNLDSAIKAIVSQVPHLDGKAATMRAIGNRGVFGTIKLGLLVALDAARASLSLSPVYIKIASVVSDPLSYMQMSESELQSYFRKHPKVYLGDWQNRSPVRTILFMSQYNPIAVVPNITAPILFIAASQDTLCPSALVNAAYVKTTDKRSKLIEKNCTHFDIYHGEIGDDVRRSMIEFYQSVLLS